jgi:hypothetical protein
VIISIVALFVITVIGIQWDHFSVSRTEAKKAPTFDDLIVQHADQMIVDGKHTFRFDTFGDEDWWGGQLQLHKAIAGEANGGVGPGVGPATALSVGLKVDVDALPEKLVTNLRRGKVNLNESSAYCQRPWG